MNFTWSTSKDAQSLSYSILSQTNKDDSQQCSILFDSDNKFQKFIQYVVDYVFIIHENVSNAQTKDTDFDLNDQSSIFIFEILMHSLSMGIVSYIYFEI